ncbi:PREDICTED: uncharacterized protein LOC108612664 [Drosophila arizonae]|uniref:Uncharacterized protein LOC108612664 n=1 Tax=Drosophila arizonae TaxID=7263 RepID=A0ABM1P1L8_DROAR|nr:PREDICTED: uncharacterized protein LOC108612664 [Drosophila arizonae]
MVPSPPVPNLLYMFDFVIDDLVIIRKNHCAPEEYATCVEFTFRSNLYINLCDREYGGCIDPKQARCAKCCIFPLDKPVTDEDRLLIHVYKKRTDRCKFLIGMTEMVVKPLFDEIDKTFEDQNTDWLMKRQDSLKGLPTLKGSNRDMLDRCECFNAGFRRREQLCPNYVVVKRMLPLFNLCNQQTGNMVLLLRLLCHGPTIVSQLHLVGNKFVPVEQPPDQHPCYILPEEREGNFPTTGYRYFSCNLDKLCPCDTCEDEFDRDCPTVPCMNKCKRIVEEYKPCGICGDVPLLPTRFVSRENLLAKRKCKKKPTQKRCCKT